MRLDALIGEQLGRYKVEALIGRGGMAAVYRALDPALQRQVALKVLYPQYLADADLVERFRREAVTAAGLDHPNIAPIFDVGDADGLVYLAMKLLPGPSLAETLQRDGYLPLPRVAGITAEIASALDEAHRQGIVHRDIKPGNVIFDRHGRAILTDFGIAKSLDAASMTESSVLIGTPDYIAPEQIDGRLVAGGQVDGRADIYALGAMVYRMLTGRRPYDGAGQAVLLAHLRDEPTPPSTLVPGLPPAVDAVIARAMAKQPDARYATAGVFAQDLEATLGETTAVGTVFPPTAIRRAAHMPSTTQRRITKALAPANPATPAVSINRTTQRLGHRRRLPVLVTVGVLIALGAAFLRLPDTAEPAGETAIDRIATRMFGYAGNAATEAPAASAVAQSAEQPATQTVGQPAPQIVSQPAAQTAQTVAEAALPSATPEPGAEAPAATPVPDNSDIVAETIVTPQPIGTDSPAETTAASAPDDGTVAPTEAIAPPAPTESVIQSRETIVPEPTNAVAPEPANTVAPAPEPALPRPTGVIAWSGQQPVVTPANTPTSVPPTPVPPSPTEPAPGATAKPAATTEAPPPSATPKPAPPTPSATTKPAPPPPTPSATARPAPPTPPATSKPAPSPTAKPVVPTATPTPELEALSCAAPMQGGFGTLWNNDPRIQTALGCPLRVEVAGRAAEQIFESGTMYWWKANQQIYVLEGGQTGRWSLYPNTYREDEELIPLDPPPGAYAPVRGFGKVWRENPSVGNALGWGVGPEIGLTGVYQRFEHGVMLYSFAVNDHERQIYVLFPNGSYTIYPDPNPE